MQAVLGLSQSLLCHQSFKPVLHSSACRINPNPEQAARVCRQAMGCLGRDGLLHLGLIQKVQGWGHLAEVSHHLMRFEVHNFCLVNWIFPAFIFKIFGLFVPFSEEKAFQHLEPPPQACTYPLKLSYKLLLDKISRQSSLNLTVRYSLQHFLILHESFQLSDVAAEV